MQECFVRLILSVPERTANLRAWLYRVARNLLIDEITEQERVMSALETELSQLNAKQKDIFIKFARLIVKNIDEL